MDCEEFLQGFSDFLDAEFEKHPLEEYNEHLESCTECGEYDRVVRRGLRLVRDLDIPEPVADLMPRLQRSFLAYRDRTEVIGEYVRAAGIVGLAVTGVMLVAAMPVLRPGSGVLELPPVVVEVETEVGRSHSLWGPPPTFSVSASFLTAPSLSEGSLLRRPVERFSLFRQPVRARLGGTDRSVRADGIVRQPAEVSPE